ncbi:MAG: hypothetical protein Q4P10_00955 [Methanomassiliicoccales archaeon]|nr:hypothetical protein [Methanomassiliicoccales archaeon]
MSEYRLSVIEERHMLSIILYLYRCGKATKSNIYDNVSKNPRMPLKLDVLEDEGLISMKRGSPTFVILTEKGRRIAESLDLIECTLGKI